MRDKFKKYIEHTERLSYEGENGVFVAFNYQNEGEIIEFMFEYDLNDSMYFRILLMSQIEITQCRDKDIMIGIDSEFKGVKCCLIDNKLFFSSDCYFSNTIGIEKLFSRMIGSLILVQQEFNRRRIGNE